MASVTVASTGNERGVTERSDENSENVSQRGVAVTSVMSEKQKELRSPLMERSNRALQKRNAPVKVGDLKKVKPINKENTHPVLNKDGKTITFSQTFLKTKSLKEKQLKEGKLQEPKAEQKPAAKPVLGAYRGKIVQSKIDSFRKPSESAVSGAPERTALPATQTNRSTTRKPMVKPTSNNRVKPPQLPPVTSQVKKFSKEPIGRATQLVPKSTSQMKTSSNTAAGKSRVSHVRRTITTTILPSQTKSSNAEIPKSKVSHVNVGKTAHIPPSQTKTSNSDGARSKVSHVTTRRTTHVSTSQTKPSNTDGTRSKVSTRRTTYVSTSQSNTSNAEASKNKMSHVTMRRTTHVASSQVKASNKEDTKSRVSHVTVRRTTINHTTSLGADVQAENKSLGLDGVQSKKRVTIGPVGGLHSAGKYPRPSESAEDRKVRLAQWRASKGKVMKRPLSSAALQNTFKVQKEEPVIKSEPEEPRQLFWATMAEEDEQELFTLKISQIFGECQKLIDENIPKEEILSLLEKQIENIPEAKTLSRYWECLARLEQREGQPYKVIEVCEEAVAAGAQPLEELRAILANTLEQLKTEPVDNEKEAQAEDLKTEEVEPEELKTEVKSETEESAVKEKSKRGRRRAMKHELTCDPSTPEKPPKSPSTLENGENPSSVIRFNITTTPHLEKIRKLQLLEGESSIKMGYKFLTPVRRSSRLERKSHIIPDMLRDHDPCIAGIAQLEDLEDPQSCPSAYIFRKNEALQEINARSLTKK